MDTNYAALEGGNSSLHTSCAQNISSSTDLHQRFTLTHVSQQGVNRLLKQKLIPYITNRSSYTEGLSGE
jgi:hypothetical protein